MLNILPSLNNSELAIQFPESILHTLKISTYINSLGNETYGQNGGIVGHTQLLEQQ